MLSLGIDHEDFLAALAPKPVIILGKERDFFDVRGTEAAYGRLKRLYELLDAPENVALFVGPTSHGYSQENREAMYKWFNRCTGVSGPTSEPKLVIEEEEDLRCTPGGQVAGLGSRPILAFTREKAAELRESRLRLDTAELRKSVAGVLRLTGREDVEAGDYRILRPRRNRGYPIEHATAYMVSTEPGVHAIVYRLSNEQWLSRPPRNQKRAVLYVSHLSSDAELREEALLRRVIEDEHDSDIYTCDVRGIGDSRPDTCDENSFFHIYGSDYFYSSISIMLDQPAPGRRTFDVLRVLAWMRETGYSEVHIVGKGWGALPAAFAALLSSAVVQVTLKNALTSYSEVAEAEDYNWPLALLIPGVLRYFDLPDVYAGLASKRLRSIEPWGANPDPG
jgi:hypothetical protein